MESKTYRVLYSDDKGHNEFKDIQTNSIIDAVWQAALESTLPLTTCVDAYCLEEAA